MARPKKFSRPGVPVPARPAKESNAKASSSKTGSDGPDRRKRGFQVGPAHAPRNAYLGKVKKIKDDLIVKAKLKKQYAKVLKETGGTSDRLRDRNAPRGEKAAIGDEGGDGDGTREEDDEAGPSDRASTLRGKGSKPSKLDRKPCKLDRKPSKDLRATGETSSASIKGDRRQPGLKRKRSDAEGATEPRPTDATNTTAQPRKVRALSPSDISAPMPQTSFRELKKEAFRKYHPARQHSSAAAPQTHAAGRRTVSGASHASHVSGPPGAGKAMRGQPNMAARMGVLLEKIKRDKTA